MGGWLPRLLTRSQPHASGNNSSRPSHLIFRCVPLRRTRAQLPSRPKYHASRPLSGPVTMRTRSPGMVPSVRRGIAEAMPAASGSERTVRRVMRIF